MPSTVKDAEGQSIEGEKNVANAFPKYLKTVPDKTKSKISTYKHPYMHYFNKSKISSDYLVLKEAHVNEVFKDIMSIKNSNSPGPSDSPLIIRF